MVAEREARWLGESKCGRGRGSHVRVKPVGWSRRKRRCRRQVWSGAGSKTGRDVLSAAAAGRREVVQDCGLSGASAVVADRLRRLVYLVRSRFVGAV